MCELVLILGPLRMTVDKLDFTCVFARGEPVKEVFQRKVIERRLGTPPSVLGYTLLSSVPLRIDF